MTYNKETLLSLDISILRIIFGNNLVFLMIRLASNIKKVEEKERIFKFFLGLNKTLDELRWRILAIKPLVKIASPKRYVGTFI